MICPGIWLLEFYCLRKVFLVLRLKDRKQSECCFFITLSELGSFSHTISAGLTKSQCIFYLLDASLIAFVDLYQLCYLAFTIFL